MKCQYLTWNPNQETRRTLAQANAIIEDFQRRGYGLTLRQLYYQLVAKDIIPNTQKAYNRIGRIITSARDAGMVDWSAIEDRTRQRISLATWNNPSEIIRSAINSYRTDKWEGQQYRVFVWVEKEALSGVISRACSEESVQVDHVSCRGYMSASTIWREAQKLAEVYKYDDQIPIILHLADHDPSGIDMTRDNMDRLELYSEMHHSTDPAPGEFYLKRIALNMNQVEQYGPPPNPAKLTDSRVESYIENYGHESWELDALDPDVLVELIQTEIDNYKDQDLWGQAQDNEDSDIEWLKERLEN